MVVVIITNKDVVMVVEGLNLINVTINSDL